MISSATCDPIVATGLKLETTQTGLAVDELEVFGKYTNPSRRRRVTAGSGSNPAVLAGPSAKTGSPTMGGTSPAEGFDAFGAAIRSPVSRQYRSVTDSVDVATAEAFATFTLRILNQNDNAPSFDGLPLHFVVNEDADPTDVFGVVQAVDIDGADLGALTYSLADPVADIVMSSGGDLQVVAAGVLDRRVKSVYNLAVIAYDGSYEARANITIEVDHSAACQLIQCLSPGPCLAPGHCVKGGTCTEGEVIPGCVVDIGCKTVCQAVLVNNLSWPSAACGVTAALPCPGGADVEGTVYRSCGSSGWGEVNTANCVDTLLLEMANQPITADNFEQVGERLLQASGGSLGTADVDNVASILTSFSASMGDILAGLVAPGATFSSVAAVGALTPYAQAISNVR